MLIFLTSPCCHHIIFHFISLIHYPRVASVLVWCKAKCEQSRYRDAVDSVSDSSVWLNQNSYNWTTNCTNLILFNTIKISKLISLTHSYSRTLSTLYFFSNPNKNDNTLRQPLLVAIIEHFLTLLNNTFQFSIMYRLNSTTASRLTNYIKSKSYTTAPSLLLSPSTKLIKSSISKQLLLSSIATITAINYNLNKNEISKTRF